MPNQPATAPRQSAGRPELVVMAKPEAGLRALSTGVASVAPNVDTASLGSLLASRGAVMRPLFGLSEDRVRAQLSALAAAAPDTGPGRPREAVPDLALFYRVAAPADQLQQLANELVANDLVEAAYVKPPGEPPATAVLERAAINDMQPAPGDAPPATPNFIARQGYLGVAPAGVDATFAWTLPGGAGSGECSGRALQAGDAGLSGDDRSGIEGGASIYPRGSQRLNSGDGDQRVLCEDALGGVERSRRAGSIGRAE